MGKDARVTYRRRHSYNTRSNKIRKVKTPGGKLSVHYVTKSAKGVKCGDCGIPLIGVRRVGVRGAALGAAAPRRRRELSEPRMRRHRALLQR